MWPPHRARPATPRPARQRHGRRRSARASSSVLVGEETSRRVTDGGVAGPPVPVRCIVEPTFEQREVAVDHGHHRRHITAGRLAQAQSPLGPHTALGDVAGHPRVVPADRPQVRSQRVAVVGVGVDHPFRPCQNVGTQPQDAVVEQRGDETGGEPDVLVVEQPVQRHSQFRERVIDLGDRSVAARLQAPAPGGLDPLDVVTGVALAVRRRPFRRWRAARHRRRAASRA